jgi:type I restriction enzyme R subunit
MRDFVCPKIYDPKSGVIEEATPEMYVEDIYSKPVE